MFSNLELSMIETALKEQLKVLDTHQNYFPGSGEKRSSIKRLIRKVNQIRFNPQLKDK